MSLFTKYIAKPAASLFGGGPMSSPPPLNLNPVTPGGKVNSNDDREKQLVQLLANKLKNTGMQAASPLAIPSSVISGNQLQNQIASMGPASSSPNPIMGDNNDPRTSQLDPITGERISGTAAENMVRQQTARRLNLLRTMLAGGQQKDIGALRANLAQRGLLDSGSLGAGIGRISADTQGRLSQGTEAAAIGETDYLLDLLKQEKQRQFAAQQAALERAQSASNLRLQSQLQLQNTKESQPSWLDVLLSGGGQALGQGLGYKLGARLV